MFIKSTIKGFVVITTLSMSSLLGATTFNFADIANNVLNGVLVNGASAGGEFGATTISFEKDGLTVVASGSDSNTAATYHAYLDSSWLHGGGGGAGGLGVCKNLDSGQCNPGYDDNVTINETLKLVFDTKVTISETIFRNGEHNPTFGANATFNLVIDRGLATESASLYSLEHIFLPDLTGTTFEFLNLNTADNDDHRFYISVMDVTAVPVPAAAWLFASGLIGLAGIARRKNR